MPMLVRVDIVPHGFLEGSHEVARAVITNTRENAKHPEQGDYSVMFMRTDQGDVHMRQGVALNVRRYVNVWKFLEELLKATDIT